jgi:isopenicillin N synthase-like dioxygenase
VSGLLSNFDISNGGMLKKKGDSMRVPTIQFTHPEASYQFTQSLRETGFAVLSAHPIDHKLIFDTFSDWKTFFERPEEEKRRYQFDPKTQAGYFPFRTENAKNSEIKDLKEFYHLYPGKPLPEGMSDRTWRLHGELGALAEVLLKWLEAHTPDEISARFSMPLSEMARGSSEILLRPICYPALKGDEEQGAIRAAAHEDINLITLLPAGTAPGLEVKDMEGNWHEVPCDPGTIVVNAGDMLQMATEFHYRSTTHRVVNPNDANKTSPRYSMPYFLHPRKEVRLSAEHTAGSYLEERLREIGLLA